MSRAPTLPVFYFGQRLLLGLRGDLFLGDSTGPPVLNEKRGEKWGASQACNLPLGARFWEPRNPPVMRYPS